MRTRVVLGVAILGLLAPLPLLAVNPGARCATAKLKAAAQKTSARLRCHARAIGEGAPVDPACLTRAEAKFTAKWARIEAAGGCATVGDVDAVESRVDAFVANIVAALPVTSTTTTTTTVTTMCPPTSTIPQCGSSSFCGPGLCAPGQTCVTSGASCACSGPPVPCGDLPTTFSGNICAYGECPPGTTCRSAPVPGTCTRSCACG